MEEWYKVGKGKYPDSTFLCLVQEYGGNTTVAYYDNEQDEWVETNTSLFVNVCKWQPIVNRKGKRVPA